MIQEPADQDPPTGGYLSNLLCEVELRADQGKIVEFLQEAVTKTEGPHVAALPLNEVSLVNEARDRVNTAVHAVDIIVKEIPQAFRIDLLAAFNDALLYAYVLGNYSTPSESICKLHGDERLKRHVKPAVKARQEAGGVQKLIEKLANDLWSRKPSYKRNPSGTANEIQPTFNREIAQWEKIPKGWEPADSRNPKSVKKEIDRIRKRVAQTRVPDDQRSSS
jgi:hypothetical protein